YGLQTTWLSRLSWKPPHATKSETHRRVAAAERRQHRYAHQHRVLLAIGDRERAGPAEAAEVGIALVAVVGGHEKRRIVVGPFPDDAVQVPHAIGIGHPRA